jgi:acyl-CoA thioesterase
VRDPALVAHQVADFMSSRDRFARSLGIRLVELQPAHAVAEMDLGDDMVNGLDLAHGAVIFALADFAFAAACNSHGRASVAMSMDIHFLASPPPGAHLEAEAVEVRRGEHTGLYHISVRQRGAGIVADVHGMAYRKQELFLERLEAGS